jgi:hypothetical protein
MVKYINIMLYEKVLKIMECHISCAKKEKVKNSSINTIVIQIVSLKPIFTLQHQ